MQSIRKSAKLFCLVFLVFPCAAIACLPRCAAAGPVEALRIFQEAESKTDPEEKRKLYLDALKEDEGFAPANNNLGIIYSVQGDFPEAVERFDAAIQIRPDFFEALNNSGYALAMWSKNRDGTADREKTGRAVTALKKAIELQPSRHEPHWNLGIVFYLSGELRDCAGELKRASELMDEQAGGGLPDPGQILKSLQSQEPIEADPRAVALELHTTLARLDEMKAKWKQLTESTIAVTAGNIEKNAAFMEWLKGKWAGSVGEEKVEAAMVLLGGDAGKQRGFRFSKKKAAEGDDDISAELSALKAVTLLNSSCIPGSEEDLLLRKAAARIVELTARLAMLDILCERVLVNDRKYGGEIYAKK